MRFALAPLAALGLLAGCGGGPTEQEENLTQTGSHPEVTANSAAAPNTGMGNPSTASGDEPLRPEGPGGPVSDRGGTGQ